MVRKTVLYEIRINPYASNVPPWKGLFTFEPNTYEVETVIRCEMDENNPDIEHESDDIQWLSTLLELVTFQRPEFLGEVSIAGSLVGVITIKSVEAFERAPAIQVNPCGEMLCSNPIGMEHTRPQTPYDTPGGKLLPLADKHTQPGIWRGDKILLVDKDTTEEDF